jgi:hypothetical protein
LPNREGKIIRRSTPRAVRINAGGEGGMRVARALVRDQDDPQFGARLVRRSQKLLHHLVNKLDTEDEEIRIMVGYEFNNTFDIRRAAADLDSQLRNHTFDCIKCEGMSICDDRPLTRSRRHLVASGGRR